MVTELSEVLIVGDNDLTGTGLSHQLEQLGYHTMVAGDEKQTFELIQTQPPDLILLASQLLHTQGSQILQQLKTQEDSKAIPVIVLAAGDDLQTIENDIELGADDYLSDLFSPALVKARIEANLEKKRLRAKVQSPAQNEAYLKVERDLQIGRDIQASFLPDTLPQPPGWEIAARFYPAREVAGDFYDAFMLTNNRRVGVVIGDVCDKGVGAALFMALFRTLIRAFAKQHYSLSWMDALEAEPSKRDAGERRRGMPSIGTSALKNTMVLTNNYILENHANLTMPMFATIFFGILDPATGSLIYINAGHNPPFIVGANGVKTHLAPTGLAVGMFPNVDYKIGEAQLEPGDILVIYTDGVTEARGPHREFFTEKRLISLLAQPAASATGMLDVIEGNLRAFMGNADQFDDITMMAVQRN